MRAGDSDDEFFDAVEELSAGDDGEGDAEQRQETSQDVGFSGRDAASLPAAERLPLHRRVLCAPARAPFAPRSAEARTRCTHPPSRPLSRSAAYADDVDALAAALSALPESRWTELDECGNTARAPQRRTSRL